MLSPNCPATAEPMHLEQMCYGNPSHILSPKSFDRHLAVAKRLIYIFNASTAQKSVENQRFLWGGPATFFIHVRTVCCHWSQSTQHPRLRQAPSSHTDTIYSHTKAPYRLGTLTLNPTPRIPPKIVSGHVLIASENDRNKNEHEQSNKDFLFFQWIRKDKQNYLSIHASGKTKNWLICFSLSHHYDACEKWKPSPIQSEGPWEDCDHQESFGR